MSNRCSYNLDTESKYTWAVMAASRCDKVWVENNARDADLFVDALEASDKVRAGILSHQQYCFNLLKIAYVVTIISCVLINPCWLWRCLIWPFKACCKSRASVYVCGNCRKQVQEIDGGTSYQIITSSGDVASKRSTAYPTV